MSTPIKFKGDSIAITTLAVIVITVIGKFLGFVREAMVASCYGASYVSDIYVLENGIVNAICTIFLCVVTTSFIPLFMRAKESGRSSNSFTCNIILALGSIGLVLSVVLLFIPDLILCFVAPGVAEKYSGAQLNLIIWCIQLSMLNVFLLLMQGLFRAIMQAYVKMLLSAGEALILNSILIAYLLFFSRNGLLGITVAMLVAQSAICVVYLIRIVSSKMVNFSSWKPSLDGFHDVKHMLKLSLPVLLMSILSQASYLVDRSVASSFAEGTMSLIGYASTIALAINSIFGESVNNVFFQKFSVLASKREYNRLNKLSRSVTVATTALLLPMIIALTLFPKEAIDLIYHKGSFSTENMMEAAHYLSLYLPGIYFFFLRDLFNRVCYACCNTKLPAISAAIGFTSTIVLNLTVPQAIGPTGIVLAVSCGAFLACAFELTIMFLYQILMFDKRWLSSWLSIVVPAFVTVCCLTFESQFICHFNSFEILLISVSTSYAVYILLSIVFNPAEFRYFLKEGK